MECSKHQADSDFLDEDDELMIESEHLNQLESWIDQLSERLNALRGYL